MGETMTRAEALRELVAVIERDGRPEPRLIIKCLPDGLSYIHKEVWLIHFANACGDDLNAVASLEAPLRERGWVSDGFGPDEGEPFWQARLTLTVGAAEEACAIAPTEPRARLLAVLRALLWEAENDSHG